MKRIKYIYLLIFILILIFSGIGIKSLIHKNKNSIRQDTQDTTIAKSIVTQDSIKNKTINQHIDTINSLMHSSIKIYSLVQDKKYEKELIKEQHDKLVDKINLDNVARSLKSNEEQERLNAIKTLSYFPENIFIPLIEKLLLNDQSSEVRGQCAVTLQLLDSKSSIPSLILSLNDQDRNVKIFATLALAALGEKEKCSVSVNSLWNSGSPDAPFYSCHMAFRDLATPDAINKLIYDLNNTDKFIAIDAAIILAQLGHSNEAFPFLEQSLNHVDEYIRMAAIRGLAYIGDQNSLKLIKSKIDDPNKLVRKDVQLILKKFFND